MIEFCHKCNKETRWEAGYVYRGLIREVCKECGDVFPCKSSKCEHLDCKDYRELHKKKK